MTIPKVDAWNAQSALTEIYQIAFGVFDHVAQVQKERAVPLPENKRPWAVHGLHPSEHLGAYNHFADYVSTFPELRIKERYGYTLEEFLDLPSWKIKLIVERCQTLNRDDHKAANSLQHELNSLKNVKA